MANTSDGVFRSEEDLSRVLSKHNPDRMKLTRTENRHALAIQDMVEGLPDLDDLSDFMYAQFAIICKDNIDDVVHRCYAIQDFREEYKIVDTYEEGCRYVKNNFDLFPEQLLSFGFHDLDGTYLFVHDFSKFEPRAFTCPRSQEDWLRGMYYSHMLYFPDMESIRKGIISVCECENMEVRRDVTKCIHQFFSEFLAYYPFIGILHFYHTGTLVNVLASALRKILPQELRNRFQVGFQFDGNLGEALLVPTVEQANKRMRKAMEEALALRYENERNFSLQPMPEEAEE